MTSVKNLHKSNIIRVWLDLLNVDSELKMLGMKMPYLRLKICSLIILITCFVTDVYTSVIFFAVLPRDHGFFFNSIHYFHMTYHNVVQTLSLMEFFTIHLIIKNLFTLMISLLEKQCLLRKQYLRFRTILILEEMMRTYEILTNTLRRYNKVISLEILLLIAFNYCYVTVQISSVIYAFFNGQITSISTLGILPMILFDVMKLGLILGASQLCQNEEGSLKKTVFKIANQGDILTKGEVNTFASQIFHNKIRVSAAGFFNIDLTVAIAILSAISSYTIILLQSDPTANVNRIFLKDN